MPFFNGTIVTKNLRNRYSFQKTLENEQTLYPPGYSYCTTDIETISKKGFQPL